MYGEFRNQRMLNYGFLFKMGFKDFFQRYLIDDYLLRVISFYKRMLYDYLKQDKYKFCENVVVVVKGEIFVVNYILVMLFLFVFISFFFCQGIGSVLFLNKGFVGKLIIELVLMIDCY